MYGIYESIFRKYRHLKSLRRISHSLRIQVRAEHHDMSVLGGICLQPFKTSLRILQHTGALIDHNIRVGSQHTFIPCSVCIIGHIPLVRLYITKSKVRPVNILLLHLSIPPFFHHCSQSSTNYPNLL